MHPCHASCNLIAMSDKIRKDDAEWRAKLTETQYPVTRKKGTEPPITGKYENTENEGIYMCVCCGQPLFASDAKFHSGSGWPSYWQPIKPENVELESDTAYGTVLSRLACVTASTQLLCVLKRKTATARVSLYRRHRLRKLHLQSSQAISI